MLKVPKRIFGPRGLFLTYRLKITLQGPNISPEQSIVWGGFWGSRFTRLGSEHFYDNAFLC